MIVAVITVRVMQSAIDEVVGMVAVRHRFVTTVGSMHMALVMSAAAGFTTVWIGFIYRQLVFVVVAFVRMVEVTVMQVINMSIMFDGSMPASGAVFMVVILVSVMVL